MAYQESDMVYHDYKRTARSDNDNPNFRVHQEHSELNRTELYEMLDFINQTAQIWKWRENDISAMKKLEKTIRLKVPSSIRTHQRIRQWIEMNFKSFWNTL